MSADEARLDRSVIGWRVVSEGGDQASVRLRCLLPLRHLAAAGRECELVNDDASKRYAAIVFTKAYRPEDIELAERARAAGTAIVFDLCDNHFLPRAEDQHDPGRRSRLTHMVELADVVSASTAQLARQIPRADVRVVDDALEDWRTVPPLPLHEKLRHLPAHWSPRPRIAWFGASGRIDPPFGLVDLERIRPELEAVCRERRFVLDVITDSRARVQRTLKGARFPWRFVRWRRTTFPHVLPLADLAVLPVQKNEFTIGKSPNRVQTALALGVAVVCDPLPSYEPFARFVRFGCTAATIGAYLADAEQRARDVAAARDHLAREWGPERLVRQWTDVLNDAIGAGRASHTDVRA